MEPKDMAHHESFAILESRKRASFHLDTSSFVCRGDDQSSPDSTASSPSSSSQSPSTPFAQPLNSTSSPPESRDPGTVKEPALGPQRTRSTSSTKGDKEKRKRSRVAPEQLVHLERFFSVDRSPTAARRREISDLLGMQERQTQIWFQNRRAKAKVQDGKYKDRSGSVEAPPDTPPKLSTGFEFDLHHLIHEDEPVTIIPCTDLSIGTWRRIATTVGKHDLVAYICDAKRCLTWFIHSAGFGFKMDISFDIIVDTEFTNAAPGSGLASFLLSQPPTFFLEHIPAPGDGPRHWKQCADWTEGHQASKVLRHNLIGSAVQLAHVLRNLHGSTQGSHIPLHSPSYQAVAELPLITMEVPQPPMVGLSEPGFHYQHDTETSRQRHHLHGRKRSCSDHIIMPHSPDIHGPCFASVDDEPRPLRSSPPASFLPPPYSQLPSRQLQTAPDYALPIFSNYAGHESQHSLSNPSLNDYGSVAISHGLLPRPYSAQPVPRTFYGDETRLVSYQGDGLRRHSSAALSRQYGSSPSPPLLTSPYHPSPDSMSNVHGESPKSPTPPVISSLPALVYESDDELNLQDDRS